MFTIQDAVIVGATYVAATTVGKLLGPTADKAGEWFATYVPLDPPAKLHSYAASEGVEQFRVDGKKAAAVAAVMKDSIDSSDDEEEEDAPATKPKNKGGRPPKPLVEVPA